MPADEVTHGTSVGESRARSGPRHAAPKKPLLTRLNMPAGKAIALAAMPTAVLMGMGFTPTLTLARADDPTKLSLTADEYKDCVEALEAAEEGTDASATPTPTPSAEESTDSTDEDTSTDEGKDTSTGDDSADDSNSSGDSASDDTATDDSASSDSGSDDKDGSASDESSTDDSDKSATDTAGSGEAPSADTSETDGGGNVLEDIGTAIEDLFTPDDKETETTPSTSTSPSPSPSPSEDASGSKEDDDAGSDAGKDAKDTAGNASDKVEDAAKDVTDTAGDTEDAEKAAEDATDDATDDATATPSPSPSESADTEGCPVATDDESGVEKGIPPLPNDPWYLDASSLLLKGADYQGVVKVKTADGSVKEVLKYVISDGTDIGDLHQTVDDKQAGVTYHVQAGKGTTSTIREGKTVMYTESISGNLLGLIPVTFDPKHPPPLNIPLIYFTKVKVVQAGQFGGTLTVPGMHQFMTD
ncbi:MULTISPECIES: hypothetical protein [Streptomyces]|uniref:hypothetical protein n=1 Tax=Streptomyces TaxID=1883 RepID=UPI0008EE909A|nr:MULTISPECIES: hypothetical protein [unclassified Streptomyces]SFN36765.1 hypothetical protein SAMN04487980_101819 [Streptomyces sp. cf124]